MFSDSLCYLYFLSLYVYVGVLLSLGNAFVPLFFSQLI